MSGSVLVNVETPDPYTGFLEAVLQHIHLNISSRMEMKLLVFSLVPCLLPVFLCFPCPSHLSQKREQSLTTHCLPQFSSTSITHHSILFPVSLSLSLFRLPFQPQRCLPVLPLPIHAPHCSQLLQYKSDHIPSQLKNHQWLPTALRTKSKQLNPL